MHEFLLAFIPVFVAVDAIGLLPVFLALTEGHTPQAKRKVMVQSTATGLAVAIGFIFVGKAVFNLMGITIGDFMVAGGVLLFCIAVVDLLTSGKERFIDGHEMGIVPLGTPLLVGPAVLTTSIIVLDQFGLPLTLVSIFLNILLTFILFLFSGVLIRVIGQGGARAISKVMALFLAAIAVMMIRKGVAQILLLP